MIKKIILIIIPLLFIFYNAPAKAQNFQIVAVVNGDVISNFALYDRINLMITSSGLQNTEEIRNKLIPQAIQTLVNEKLQEQDAKKNRIMVSDKDMENAIADLEAKNNLQPGEFDAFIAKQGIYKNTLLNQIKSQILWQKIVSSKIHPKIVVTDYEIKDTLEWLSSKKINEEVYLSEILISVEEDKKNENEAKELAEKLVEEIKKGKSFSGMAEQFSSSGTASKGGAIGWVPVAQVDNKELQEAIQKATAHQVLSPIRTDAGYQILKIGNKRNSTPTITDKKIKERLVLQKIDLESKSYMKNLRRSAFVEIRL